MKNTSDELGGFIKRERFKKSPVAVSVGRNIADVTQAPIPGLKEVRAACLALHKRLEAVIAVDSGHTKDES